MTISVKKPPNSRKRRERPLVVTLIYDELCHFEFACTAEVFGLTRPEFGNDWYRFMTCSIGGRTIRGQLGMRITPDAGLESLESASIVVIPGWRGRGKSVPQSLITALRVAHARGATLLSICSGAFVLAATGLLDGERATTHWRCAEEFQRLYPQIDVDPDVLYIDSNRVMTSAGSAAGLDLCLHVVRRDYGPEIANEVARRLVIAPHRDGGQAQFVKRAVQKHERNAFSRVLERMRNETASDFTIAQWAEVAAMSERTFLRRFRETTGMTPREYIAAARLDRARELLETSALSIDIVALECGFGGGATLRHHFRAKLGITPTAYRNRFGQSRNAVNL